MYGKFIGISVCGLVMLASADEHTLKPEVSGKDFDWTLATNYEHDAAPESGDTVVIPEGVTAKVTAGDNASFKLVNSLYRITPESGAKLVVSVSEGDATLACAVCGILSASQPDSALEKTGAGTLTLTSVNKVEPGSFCLDYGVNLTVKEGILQLPQNRAAGGKPLFMGTVSVADSAQFVLSTPHTYEMYVTGLSGAGTVAYNGTDGVVRLYVYETDVAKSMFAGKITGKIQLRVRGNIDLTGTQSDYTGSPVVEGRLGVAKFGAKRNSVGSIGAGEVNFSGENGVVECLATEAETTGKQFWWSSCGTIDAGAFGGVTFIGQFNGVNKHYVVHLTGSNTTECVLNNVLESEINETCVLTGTPCVYKTGSGTWRMAAGNRGMHGVIHVADGTLKFDSIAQSGTDCSVGFADCLRECTSGTIAGLAEVGYAFLLGGDSTTGTLEYSGTDAACNATRPIAVKSNGGFVSSSAEFTLQDVYALGAGEKTIALGGASGPVNRATGFSDGTDGGRLSVVKEGDGEWYLWGTNTFTGNVSAKGGKLVVWNPEKRYTWFRFTVKENLYGDSDFNPVGTLDDADASPSNYEKGYVQIHELQLYDSDGNNIAKGIAMDAEDFKFDETTGYAGLGEGEVGYGRTSNIDFGGNFSNLFDGSTGVARFNAASSSGGIKIGDENTWVPIVFRLPATESRTVVAMDIASGTAGSGAKSYCGRNLKSFRFEGSTDGVDWDVLFDDKNDLAVPDKAGYYYSDTDVFYTHDVRADAGYELERGELPEKAHRHAFTGVGAANGGVLEVVGETYTASTLVIDASGTAGEIRNVVFAENGVVNVENVESMAFDSLELPGDFSSITGHGNLADWDLVVNGEACIHKTLAESNGKLTLRALGLKVIIR